MTYEMKNLVNLLVEQSPPEEIYMLYKDLNMPEVCEYIKNKYMTLDERYSVD